MGECSEHVRVILRKAMMFGRLDIFQRFWVVLFSISGKFIKINPMISQGVYVHIYIIYIYTYIIDFYNYCFWFYTKYSIPHHVLHILIFTSVLWRSLMFIEFFLHSFLVLLCFWDRMSLYSTGWPQTCDPSATAFQVLGFTGVCLYTWHFWFFLYVSWVHHCVVVP
jgi:hypothetical protein